MRKVKASIGNDIQLMDGFSIGPQCEFTSDGNTFIEVACSDGSVSVNGVIRPVKGHCLIVCFQGQIVKSNIIGATVARAAVFSDRFMEDLYHGSIKFSDLRTIFIENPVVHIDKPTSRRLDLYAGTMREIAADPDVESSLVCAKFETLSLLHGPLGNCLKKRPSPQSSRKAQLSSEFFTLLKSHFKTEHRLKYYADLLYITDRYLYVCVESVTGKAPSYWVDYYLLLEAKKLLIENTLTINQISETLGFSGPSQFGKFFKKHEGTSARLFRVNYSKQCGN